MVATADKIFFCFLNTFTMTLKLLEYLKNLKARKTFKVLNSRKILSKRKPLFRGVNDGKMDSRSMIAIGVIGYTRNDLTDFFSLRSAVINRSPFSL